MAIYLLQLDTSLPHSQFLNIIEKLGNFCIYKNSYIVNTKINKSKIRTKFKKVLSKDDQVFVKEIKEDELTNFPFIVKEWFYKNTHQQENNQVDGNYEPTEQDVLNRLNLLLDTVREELNKQELLRKEE